MRPKRLHDSFEKAIVIIEGDNSELRINKNALIGAMLSSMLNSISRYCNPQTPKRRHICWQSSRRRNS